MPLQVAGSDQLASLGPNSLIFSFATYIFSALSIATIRWVPESLPLLVALRGETLALKYIFSSFNAFASCAYRSLVQLSMMSVPAAS